MDAVETLEDMRLIAQRDPDAVVGNNDENGCPLTASLQADFCA